LGVVNPEEKSGLTTLLAIYIYFLTPPKRGIKKKKDTATIVNAQKLNYKSYNFKFHYYGNYNIKKN